MTALAIADLHLSEKARDAYRFAAMERIAALVEQYKVDELLVLGDLTESKDYHPASLVNDVVDIMYSFSCLANVYINRGNHDYTETDTPFFHFLRRFKRIQWINSVKLIELTIGRSLFLPHTRDWENEWPKTSLKSQDWIFAHNTFEGAETEHGKRLSGIPASALLKGARVVSGDIHKPQTLDSGITYVGAPYQVDFGDDFDPRVLLLTQKGFTSIPLPGPQKRLIELKKGYKLSKIEAEPGDIVKVRYQLTSDEQPDWFEIKSLIKEQLSGKGLTVHLVQPEMTLIKSKRVNIRKVETKSDERIVQEFGSQRQLPKDTLAAGMVILQEA